MATKVCPLSVDAELTRNLARPTDSFPSIHLRDFTLVYSAGIDVVSVLVAIKHVGRVLRAVLLDRQRGKIVDVFAVDGQSLGAAAHYRLVSSGVVITCEELLLRAHSA